MMREISKLLDIACFVLWLFIGCITPVYGQPPNHPFRPPNLPRPYEITPDTAAYTRLPDTAWQMVADPGGKLTLQQVSDSDYFSDTDRKINYQVHVYWIRYRLVNPMAKATEIALPVAAAYADLYTKTDSAEWQHARTGSLVRWSRRDGLKRIPAFLLTLPAGETVTVYQRVYWDYVAAQPDSMAVYFVPAPKLIQQDYINDESYFMTSIQDAFLLGMFVLSLMISFYFFLAVREKEFLYFSIFLLASTLEALSSLNDVFLREYPGFLLYLYIFSSNLNAFFLIHFLRYFLKTFIRFPKWDKILIAFSFILIVWILSCRFASAVLHTNLAAASHFSYNLSMLVSGIVVLVMLYLYIRERNKAVRLMIIALTPILCLKVLVYILFIIYRLYSPRFGAPTLHGYVLAFNKVAFFILILCYMWMMLFFNWVLFLRFFAIRQELMRQSILDTQKSRFFANISHEFRTPLTLIMGPLEDILQGGSIQKFKDAAPVMYRHSKRLLRLVNQLLDLSRLAAGKRQVNTAREDIIPYIRQIVHSFSSPAEEKNIELKIVVDPRTEAMLKSKDLCFYFDEDILEKIITNLLFNALKFTPAGGNITVSVGVSERDDQYLELKVKDSGIGIPLDKQPYVFDRFYQADDSDIRRHEGSGIGLALAKELIELHQGKIEVASMPGKWTVFTCYLPLNKRIISAKATSGGNKTEPGELPELILSEKEAVHKKMKAERGAPRILLVEDHKEVREYIMDRLQGTFNVTEAGDGKEGLAKAFREIPDLVISDVMMPEMDGFELCKSLKSDDRTSHIPVILLTARAEDTDKMAGLETGADAYLIKPFHSKELLVRVDNLISIRNKMRAKFSKKLAVKPSEIATTSRDRLFMDKLLAVTEDHISDVQFSVERLGQEVNMSVSQINRKLKAIINQTASQFIRSVRMQRALDLLRNDVATIGEVSYRVGFEDPGYFTKVFKHYFGCLPSEREKFPSDDLPGRS
jgi:signal transduction histidine kinase/DNA-binding response OmpR family regulator